MAATETLGFVRLPPDSTGKRIPHSLMMEVGYTAGTQPFVPGLKVVFATSGVAGTVAQVDGTTASGYIHILIGEPVPVIPASVIGENITVGGVPFATASDVGVPYYFQQSVIVGFDNPANGLSIDSAGAASVRYTEGAPQFDAFGKMQVSQQTTIAEYLPQYDVDPERVGVYTSGTGSSTHLPSSSGVLLSVGTASGDSVTRASHMYHTYQAGVSQLLEATAACGDTGKVGCTRIWGYGDESDGLFFSLKDTTVGVLKRSTASGSFVETFVPQSQWNKDRLDGSGGAFNPSGVTLNVTNDNIYWIDMQWLGAGRVRFGVVMGRQRIVCHEIAHANTQPYPYMRTGTLPVYAKQFNTAATGSSSEMRVWCMTVKTEGAFDPQYRLFSTAVPQATITSATAVPYVSFRSKQLYNSNTNRVSAYGTKATMLLRVVTHLLLSLRMEHLQAVRGQ